MPCKEGKNPSLGISEVDLSLYLDESGAESSSLKV